ncbi:hypothetical protein HNV11_08570 [Spirosoma taeanense]|uniref:Uncharacterized protein n=1 Tax=Spirosoma taeanense TaxID=2735870 RepID=A0A6M5Y7H7_9BACT|nr:hypothetical protein [Spirosoma taeanense]QJW89434.1 hypothetical protein HNV11_08570 [Spirosoma taeanense]
MNRLLLYSLTALFSLVFCPHSSSAQAKPAQKTYTFLIYHKLAPGYTIQDALPIEREWKTLNQAAVDEGNLEGWYMMVKQFSSNPNPAEYDYVTRIVGRDVNLKGASPAALTRIYGDSAKARMADLQKRDRTVAPVVKIEIWETLDAAYAPGFAPGQTPLMVVDRIRRKDPVTDTENLVSQMKRLSEERIKRNTLAGWDFSALIIPNGSEKGFDRSVAYYVGNLSAIANPGLMEAAGAIMTPQAYKQFRNQIAQTFDVVRQEVYRFMEFTTKAGN